MDSTTLPIKPLAGRPRRRHSATFKATVVAACQHPGASIAGIALANGINANLLRRWIHLASGMPNTGTAGQTRAVVTSFIPVQFEPEPQPPAMTPPASDIRIEVQRGASIAKLHVPANLANAQALNPDHLNDLQLEARVKDSSF